MWHNPNCSKSRAALKILEERGEPFQTREYLHDVPSMADVRALQQALNMPPIEWARTSDEPWLEHFDHATIYDDLLPDDDDILRAMVKFPSMIERPILAVGDRAVVGRPPERILTLLDGASADASPSSSPKIAGALEALTVAAEAARARGVADDSLERSLLRMAAEIHMLQ